MENRILNLFLFHNKLRFKDIQNSLNIRSNKLAYHIKKLLKKGMLIKRNNFYILAENAEYLIPYISDKSHVLPVILIYLGNKKECFLFKRKKRPYKDYLSLPGGRLLLGESIENAVTRIMKEKFNINSTFNKINSISLEHVKRKNKIIHSFLLIFISAKTKDDVILTKINKNRKIIKSDYYLMKNKLNSRVNMEVINSVID